MKNSEKRRNDLQKTIDQDLKFISRSRQKHIKFLNEALGSIREIMLNNNYNFYIKNFFNIDQPMRKKMAENDFISNFPKALVETVALIYLAFLSLYVIKKRQLLFQELLYNKFIITKNTTKRKLIPSN